jgi:hypothetical protein
VKFANPRDDAALGHSSEAVAGSQYRERDAVLRVARQRDESEEKLNGAAEPIMRQPSRAGAAAAKDAGEFHGSPHLRPQLEPKAARNRVSATAKR